MSGIRVPYLDLRVQDDAFRAQLLAAVDRVLRHGRFIMGPEHDEFERRFAQTTGRAWAVGVNSGTDALYFALRALGIGPGDEVITTPLTWVATTNAIVLAGATPVYVDVGADFCLDVGRVEAAITPRAKAVAPVHFTGQLCDVEPLRAICARRGLVLIEDAAQAFGATYEGRPAGAFGRLATFSINPMKVFNGFGEAGAVVGDDPALREKLIALRYNGTVNKEDCHYPSLNGRLDTVQAAMLLVNLDRVAGRIAHRRALAAVYDRRLAGVVETPRVKPGFAHTYYTYSILGERRDALKAHLLERGIETKVQHPFLMPYHTAYRGKFPAHIPNAERIIARLLCLPCHEAMGEAEATLVAEAVREFYGAG